MGIILGALQDDDQSTRLSADLEKSVCLGNLLCALEKWKGYVGVELRLAAIVTTDIKCTGKFQEASNGTLGGMIKEVAQIDSMVLVDDNLSDRLEKCTYVPIQEELAIDDDTHIGATMFGDELVLDAVQWVDSWSIGEHSDAISVGSQDLETVIREIAQPPLGRYGLSKYAKRRAKKRQQLVKVAKEETDTPFWNALIYEESDMTKHVV